MRRARLIIALVLATLALATATGRAQRDAAGHDQFLTDLQALTQHPHRLAATPENHDAADYIEDRLRGLGVTSLYTITSSVAQVRTDGCSMRIDGRQIDVHPLRPNLIIPPASGAQGVTGRYIYAGKGTLREYGSADPNGAIIGLEYDSETNWKHAFRLGARAVVFIGGPDAASVAPKSIVVPANLIRVYADGEAHGELLRRNHDEVTVRTRTPWRVGTSRNILGLIPGTDPKVDVERAGAEIIVLSAHYDSFGTVPSASPGARAAANVAALLQIAEHLQAHRPRRHVLLAFFDNHAQQRQGARIVYRALKGDPDDAARFAEDRRLERGFIDRALQTLKQEQWLLAIAENRLTPSIDGYERAVEVFPEVATDGGAEARQAAIAEAQRLRRRRIEDAEALQRALKLRADHIDADIKFNLLPINVQESSLTHRSYARELTEPERRELAGLREQIEQLQAKSGRVDVVRELLSEASAPEEYRALPEAIRRAAPQIIEELHDRLVDVYRTRRAELEREIAADQAAATLRERLQLDETESSSRIALHMHLNLSGSGPTWGVVAGDTTTTQMIGVSRDADQPSFYTNILRACRTVVEEQGAPEHFETMTLEQPSNGSRFVSGPMVSDGLIAGLYGVYNVSLVTGSDARPRDGHPSDTLANLNWRRIARFAGEAAPLIRGLADTSALPGVDAITPIALNTYRAWDRTTRRANGNYGLYRVTGGLKEDRAARGAVMAIWPSGAAVPWDRLSEPLPANFMPAWVRPVDAYGLFDLVSFALARQTDPVNVFGAILDDDGRIVAASNEETLEQAHAGRYRVEIIPSRDFAIAFPVLGVSDPLIAPFKIMGAVTNTTYPKDRQHVGQSEDFGFAHIADRVLRTQSARMKVFSEKGPVILGLDDLEAKKQVQQIGIGVPARSLQMPPAIHRQTADDLWMLGEMRLQTMRSGGIANAALEGMHIKAKRARDRGAAVDDVHTQTVSFAEAAQLERRIYQPIRDAMNDLVRAVVFLLLLAIPFAFAAERLLIGATTIYGRLGGFVAIFAITFASLYVLHPGFGVAAVPLIILLAFIIILLATLVIYILLRKFNTELREMQGQSSRAHDAQMSRTGTLVAAANMGISTMRRRPLRTTLTALTVVLLTFTILCFASVGSAPGVKRIYLGSAGSAEDADLLIRKPDYTELQPSLPEVIEGREGPRGLVAQQWWVVREKVDEQPMNVTRSDDGRSQYVQAIWGVTPAEMKRWPDFRQMLRADGEPVDPNDIGPRDAFLPPVIRDQLGLAVGDELLVEGLPARFAGIVLTSDLQRLKHIDGEPALPVNFQDTSVLATLQEQETLGDEQAAEVQRAFARLSPNQVAVVPVELAKRMRGTLRIVRVYLDPDLKAEVVGHDLAEIMPTPVWSRGTSGAERLIFASLIQVEAGQELIVPLLLGGLIVFGTMLGSISDREKEIYTFSALGLAPSHVGLLFFAEAAVYAVVGGMAGQILAQLVALVTSAMNQAGWINAPEFNFSSTNALFAIFIVMATVMVSALYPAMRASGSANPGLARTWTLPRPDGDDLNLIFPFTVSAYDITGVVSFLAEHFRAHDDAGVGGFAAHDVGIERAEDGNLSLSARVALSPFDLGVTQRFRLTATPSEIPGVDEVAIHCHRLSGTHGDWRRTNKVFIRALRKQFLLWRTLSEEAIESYRMRTLHELGEAAAEPDQRGDATRATEGAS